MDILDFIHNNPTPYHVVEAIKTTLSGNGFVELHESEEWEEIPSKFFVVRDGRAIIALNIKTLDRSVILASHDDSPCFKSKPNAFGDKNLVSIAPYGGGMWRSWVDRDLKVAGRALTKSGWKLFNIDEAVGFIPTVAIHLDSKSGLNPTFNLQDNFKVMTGCDIMKMISRELGEEILDTEIYFVPVQKPNIINNSLSAPRLDDMSSVYTTLSAFLSAGDPNSGTSIFAVFDNEEVGSNTRCGANGNFLPSVIQRIHAPESFWPNTILVSADTPHGNNPNFDGYSEEFHKCKIGEGPVYAWHPQKYFATDTDTSALFIDVAKRNNYKLGKFALKNGQAGGMSFGGIITSQNGVKTIDIGIPVLAMHSIREVCSLDDINTFRDLLIAVIREHL